MNSVYLLHHTYEDETHEDVKLIGVFSSEKSASAIVSVLRGKHGFRDHQDGFSIEKHQIDQASWLQGFGASD